MSTGQGSTISDAPVAARAIDLYELSGILLPGILVAAATLLGAHLTYGDQLATLVPHVLEHEKWGTVMAVLMLSGFFAISYLLGNACVIFGQIVFSTLIMDVLVGPPIVVLAFPHLSPAYRRSPRAAILRLLLFSLVGFVLAPQIARLLARDFSGLSASWLGRYVATDGAWLASRGLWGGLVLFCWLTYQVYYIYEIRIALILGVRTRTDIDREMVERGRNDQLDGAVDPIMVKMEFNLFASTWAILPLGSPQHFFASEADPRCKRVDSRYRASCTALSLACREAIAGRPGLFAHSVLLTLAMSFVQLCNLPLRMIENAFLKILLCMRPLSSHSLMRVLSHFHEIRHSAGFADRMSDRFVSVGHVEAYYTTMVEDSFRMLFAQVLANMNDSTVEKSNLNFSIFKIVSSSCGSMIAISLLFSVVPAQKFSELLSLFAAALAFVLLLRGLFLRYQVYERELYVAFSGLPIERLRNYFAQSEKPRWRLRPDGDWVRVRRG